MFLDSWWWIAPAGAAAGAAGYGALTVGRRQNGRRRARRLELDAARHEQQSAYRALVAARAEVRSAQALVLTARSQQQRPLPGTPTLPEAKRRLSEAKQALKAATLEVRASRSRVKAVSAQRRLLPADAPLPIERLMAVHDAITARWLEYETDAGKALDFPQMLDSRHPATLAFLQAQRHAQDLRPGSALARVTPAQYLEYRDALGALEAAFAAAEKDAHRTAREEERRRAWRVTPPKPRDSPSVSADPRTAAGPAAREEPRPSAPPSPAPRERPASGERPPIWPVPSRSSKRPESS